MGETTMRARLIRFGFLLGITFAAGCGPLAWDKDDGFIHRAAAKDIREVAPLRCSKGQHPERKRDCPKSEPDCPSTCVDDK